MQKGKGKGRDGKGKKEQRKRWRKIQEKKEESLTVYRKKQNFLLKYENQKTMNTFHSYRSISNLHPTTHFFRNCIFLIHFSVTLKAK